MKTFEFKGKSSWKVFRGTKRSQSAEMVIKPGDAEGGADNRHPRSDQWLFVISGRGVAKVNGRAVLLTPGTLLLVEKNETHQILATGRGLLKTLNFYSPPAY
jgi:mannose-6-phosphate isomerase-like protein (cupin superfamily)